MTELLEKAFAEAANLPEEEQNELAKVLLEDLAAEEKWDQAFANSHDKWRPSRMKPSQSLSEARHVP